MTDTLLNIARCQNVNLQGDANHPCSEIIRAQKTTSLETFQVPEPWRGNILSAPLLFIASNPSWDATDDSPKWSSPDEKIIEYYNQGFPSIFPKIFLPNGAPRKGYVHFWASIRARAAELYRLVEAKTLKPGVDFAITELVHCKSRKEIGVEEAMLECMELHLESTMRSAGARVLVVLGDIAQRALKLKGVTMPQYRDWFGLPRHIIWLPHPNARKERKFSDHYTEDQLCPLHEALLNSSS